MLLSEHGLHRTMYTTVHARWSNESCNGFEMLNQWDKLWELVKCLLRRFLPSLRTRPAALSYCDSQNSLLFVPCSFIAPFRAAQSRKAMFARSTSSSARYAPASSHSFISSSICSSICFRSSSVLQSKSSMVTDLGCLSRRAQNLASISSLNASSRVSNLDVTPALWLALMADAKKRKAFRPEGLIRAYLGNV